MNLFILLTRSYKKVVNYLEIIIYFIIGAFLLFVIIVNAVKMAMKEVLHEFKEDITNEFNLGKANDTKVEDGD